MFSIDPDTLEAIRAMALSVWDKNRNRRLSRSGEPKALKTNKNGVYSSPKIPEIIIDVEEKANEWILSIKDNGPGIDEKYHEKIFVIFQRLHSKEKYPGTGIGLAICKKIVERHGGKIWIESEIDEGTTFYFTIRDNLKSPI